MSKYIYIIIFKQFVLDDHSRVVLKLENNCPGSDYINASFIDVSDWEILVHLSVNTTHRVITRGMLT